MAKDQKIVRRAFNAGEVSPQFSYRNDTEKHAFACSKLSNFYVSPIGAISRREGTRLIGVLGSAENSDNVRILPFEYNREFSYIFALHTSDVSDAIKWTTDDFLLPSVWSMCFTIPQNLNGARNILTKGGLSIVIDEFAKLIVSSGGVTLTAQASFNRQQKIAIVRSGNSLKIYSDTVLKSQNANFVFADQSGSLVMTAMDKRGDTWGLKILTCDITAPNAYYTLSDFQNGLDEHNMLSRTPDYSNATSVFGSSIAYEDGKIKLGPAVFDAPVLEEGEESVEPEMKVDYIKIPFNAKSDADFSLLISFLNAENCRAYLAKSASPDTVIKEFSNANENFTIDEDADTFVLKFYISTSVMARYEATFSLEAKATSILASISSSWSSDKIIKLDIFSINGTRIATDIVTPIPSDVLHEFQYKQVNGYLFIAHSSFAPKRFEFKLDGGQITAAWTDAATFHPSCDTAEDGVVITCGADTDANKKAVILSGVTGTVSANKAFFTANMIGSQLKLEYSDKAQHTYKWAYRKANNGQRDGYYINASTVWIAPSGKVTVKPEGGVWEGVLVLEESTDNGISWSEIGRSSCIQGSENTQFEREVYNVRSLVRARLAEQRNVEDTTASKVVASTEGCFFNIYTNSTCCAWVEIQTVSADGKTATVKFLNPCRAYFQTDKVYKSAWSDTFGFPQTVDVHEERLTLGGNLKQPSTVWLSQTNNWDNFRSISNLDTDPLAYSLANDDGEPIAWIVSKSDLMIGLGSSEWSLGSRDASQSLTAKIVKASNQSQDGVEYIMPTKAANMVIYVRRGNRELGSISYDFASDAYNSISLTTMCPEILGDGVKSIFNQLSPKNYIWAIRNDGVCAVFTYDKENNVSAWSRFIFGDGVISACPLSTGQFRSVFLVVKRNGFMCLERLDPNEMGTGNWRDCVAINDDVEIPNGLETSVRYSSEVETTPIFSEGNVKVSCIELMMINSYGGKYRLNGYTSNGERFENEADWRNIAMKSFDLIANPTPKTYRFIGNCDSGFLEECSIEIKTDEPAPFTLCAIAVKAGGF